jgi:hypothetical protein
VGPCCHRKGEAAGSGLVGANKSSRVVYPRWPSDLACQVSVFGKNESILLSPIANM